MSDNYLQSIFEEIVSEQALELQTSSVRKDIESEWGEEQRARILPNGWLGEVSVDEFVDWFKNVIKHEESSGKLALLFARIVLSIIGDAESLDGSREEVIKKICQEINTRSLPTLLWANFVEKNFDSPNIISHILMGCVRNTARSLEVNLANSMNENNRRIPFVRGKPVLIYGYSAAVIAAVAPH